MADNKKMAADILAAVGGKENISFATHCITRLRLNVKNREIISVDEIKKITGVLGCQYSGEQLQVIIGAGVPKVYDEFCAQGGIKKQSAVDENLDSPKDKKRTPKAVLNTVMDTLAGCLAPNIPILMLCGIVKAIVSLIGPGTLGWAAEGSDIIVLLTMLGDAGFYFLPFFVAHSAAKKLNASVPLTMLIAAVMMHPTMLGLVEAGESFTVFGMPMTLTTYSSTVIPVILVAWVLSYVERFFRKYIPDALGMICVPLATMIVMLPVSLCILGPIGSIAGNLVCSALIGLHELLGPLGVAIMGAVYIPMVATGMHVALFPPIIAALASPGYDNLICPSIFIALYSFWAVAIGFFLKAKNANDRSLGASCTASIVLGGTSEPTIFGIMFPYRRTLLYGMAGAFAGCLYAGIMNVKSYNLMGTASFICDDPSNFTHGIIASVIAFAVTFIPILIWGYDSKKTKKSEKTKKKSK